MHVRAFRMGCGIKKRRPSRKWTRTATKHGYVIVCFHTLPQTQFQCGHCMCPRCTHQMLRHDGRCPLCRTTITSCNPVLIDCTGFPNAFYIELVRTTDDERFGITIGDDMTVARNEKDSIAYMAGVRCKNMILEVESLRNRQTLTERLPSRGRRGRGAGARGGGGTRPRGPGEVWRAKRERPRENPRSPSFAVGSLLLHRARLRARRVGVTSLVNVNQ